MNQDKAMELVAALRSGKYTQGKNRLKDGDNYCCLGVACLVAGRTFDEVNWCEGVARVLPNSVRKYFEFYNTSGGRIDDQQLIFENADQGYETLTDANDSGQSFAKIADYIEKNWEHL